MNDTETQANPVTEPDLKLAALREDVQRVVKVLDENRKGITRWFFRFLLAFNLILGSVALWATVMPRLLDLL